MKDTTLQERGAKYLLVHPLMRWLHEASLTPLQEAPTADREGLAAEAKLFEG